VSHRLPHLRGSRGADDGQGLVEFSLLLPVFLILLVGMLEFGLLFDHHLSLGYASREGARVGSALVNGGGPLGCDFAAGQSPNAANVDRQIVAAVQRVLTSPGSAVVVPRIGELRIYRADASGNEIAGDVNVWTYSPGGGPVVDGKALDFAQQSGPWTPCERRNDSPPHSIGISLTYTYQFTTPLAGVLQVLGGNALTSLPISDRTIMAMNPTQT
jgi:hypothetical protein